MSESRRCLCGCGLALPPDAHGNSKYLNPKHRNRGPNGYKPKGQPSVPLRGPAFDEFVADGWPQLIEDGMPYGEVETLSGINRGTISRMMKAYREDAKIAAAPEIELDEQLFSDLVAFTETFFPEALVPDFHREWVEAIDGVVGSGSKLMLLAPQRHGKSEMLIRYCLMRIARDPNIRILWVSKTAKLAEKMVGYIRQHLEHNTKLRDAVIGEHRSFVPGRTSGLPWTNSEFTIANRTEIRKTPTMVAIGTGGQILGLDADLVILDDPQDRKRCMSPANRDADAEWFLTDFLSRKEEETGVAFIMSRQHIDDLPSRVLKSESEIGDWDVRVYRAHDPVCTKPDAAEHVDCVLWPKKRTWEYLLGQKQANPDHFERNYMNNPVSDATTYITADEIAKIRDNTRQVGEVPSGCRLVAGIDPAEAKPVAAVLWGFDGVHRHVIDAVEASASVVGMREILVRWKHLGVREFAFEKNMGTAWLLDTEVKSIITRHGLKIHEHYTSRTNKQSLAIGPISMFQKMRSDPPEVTIPGMAGPGQDRIDRLLRSWLSFDPDWAGHKHQDDDLTMASWFGSYVIDGWDRPQSREMQVDYMAFGGF